MTHDNKTTEEASQCWCPFSTGVEGDNGYCIHKSCMAWSWDNALNDRLLRDKEGEIRKRAQKIADETLLAEDMSRLDSRDRREIIQRESGNAMNIASAEVEKEIEPKKQGYCGRIGK